MSVENEYNPAEMNVLVIMCDQLRYDALSCHGNPYTATPNLDRLAARSVQFEQCYTQSPVCSPARHSLATGKYPHAHGVLTNNHQSYEGLYTIAHALQPKGYRRFHLGHMHWKRNDLSHGYEPIASPHLDHDRISAAASKRSDWEHVGHTRRTTGGPSPNSFEEHWGHQVACESIGQIESAVRGGEHFISWTSFTEPHPPFYPPKSMYEKFDQSALPLPVEVPQDSPAPHASIIKKQREWAHLTAVEKRQMKAGYYGMVELADQYVGRMLDLLDRLELWDKTIVIFTADHGEQLGDHGLFMKFVLREASVHVPLMICAPGMEPGTRRQFVEHVDLFPTICDLVGAAAPEDLHGKSLKPLLTSADTPPGWRDAVFSRIGNDRMIRTANWKLNVYDEKPGELYNLREDPNELNNLVNESEYHDTISKMYHLVMEATGEADQAPKS